MVRAFSVGAGRAQQWLAAVLGVCLHVRCVCWFEGCLPCTPPPAPCTCIAPGAAAPRVRGSSGPRPPSACSGPPSPQVICGGNSGLPAARRRPTADRCGHIVQPFAGRGPLLARRPPPAPARLPPIPTTFRLHTCASRCCARVLGIQPAPCIRCPFNTCLPARPTGASALDKKAKKAFEAQQLQKLGAKADARPRIPASIGFGMARKAAQRADRALQEGIAGAPPSLLRLRCCRCAACCGDNCPLPG